MILIKKWIYVNTSVKLEIQEDSNISGVFNPCVQHFNNVMPGQQTLIPPSPTSIHTHDTPILLPYIHYFQRWLKINL
jgi:hypothetical protein